MQNLKNLAHNYYSLEFQNRDFLFNRKNGEVFCINKSAKLMLDLAKMGLDNSQIVNDVSDFMSVQTELVAQDLNKFSSQLAITSETHDSSLEDDSFDPDDFLPLDPPNEKPVVRNYLVANQYFSVSYPSIDIERRCHAILAPLSVEETPNQPISIEIKQGSNGYLLSMDSTPTYFSDDPSLIPDYLRSSLLDAVGELFDNWLGVHAAAILTEPNTAILLAAPSGSGKSTLSVELSLQGYGYLGDDMQILDLDNKKLFPFPTSANLKTGSWPLFESRHPELKEMAAQGHENRPVKYLPIAVSENILSKSIDVKAIVFPTYDPAQKAGIQKMTIEDLVGRLTESGCYSQVEASAEMSQKYVEFFLSLERYQLTYSSSEQAIQLLRDQQIIDT